MRFSTATALLSMPLLALADVNDYQAQFQNQFAQYWDKVQSYIPNPNKHDPIGAAEAKIGSMKMHILTVDNWRDTLYTPVKPGSKTPEEWYVLITGGNKTCFGHCGVIEKAFNQSAAKFAVTPKAPYVAMLNCDNQPILCNAWSAATGNLWVFEMLPEPSPIDIYTKRLNLTTTTADEIIQFHKEGAKNAGKIRESYFHPFNGPIAQNGLSIPVGYALWVFGLIPSWAFMVTVSMLSRTFMGRGMNNMGDRAGGAGAAPGTARPAAPQ